jgi:MFS family permease
LGWGVAVFLVVLQFLAAVGLYFRHRTEFHTSVELRGDWVDRAGAFWLVSCAFGPLLGWIVTSGTIPITATSWQWLYGLRAFLAAGIPGLLALPATRYIRGKSSWVTLPLLLIVTSLPVSTAMGVSLDLWKGPITQQDNTGKSVSYLRYTGVQFNKPD